MTKKIFKNYISNILFVQTAPKKKKNLGCFLCVMLLKNCPVQVLLIPKKTLEGTTLVTDFHLRQLKNKNSNGTSPSKVIVNGLCGNCAYFQNS